VTNSHALAQLIDSVEQTNNWSDTDVVRRAGLRGHVISKQTISRYRTEDPLISIKGSVILALADGLGVTPAQVATAALSAMRVPFHAASATDAEVAVRADVSLNDDVRGMLLAVLRQYHDSRRKPEHEDEGTQTSTPRNPEAGSSTRIGAPIGAPTEDDENNVHALNRRKQGSTPAPDFANPGELAAAREEPGYTKSGKRDRGFDEDHPSE
jgi:transcriptional regulator with XRE-family HTH domain